MSRSYDPDAYERRRFYRRESAKGKRKSRTCPTCKTLGALTAYEAARGYQCASCTRRDEGYGFNNPKGRRGASGGRRTRRRNGAPWEDKAHRLIASHTAAAARQVGRTKGGKQRPYSVPLIAQALVEALGIHDSRDRELAIKRLFEVERTGAWTQIPENVMARVERRQRHAAQFEAFRRMSRRKPKKDRVKEWWENPRRGRVRNHSADPRTVGYGIPDSATVVDPQGTDLVILTWDKGSKIYGIAFAGRARKPVWHHRFFTAADRAKRVRQTIEGRKARAKQKAERAVARKAYRHPFKVGDIFYTSWGYNQTNVDYFEVIEAREKSMKVRKIGKSVDRSARGADYVVPVPGNFIGKAKRVIPRDDSFKVDGHYASKWHGRPVYETAPGWGH